MLVVGGVVLVVGGVGGVVLVAGAALVDVVDAAAVGTLPAVVGGRCGSGSWVPPVADVADVAAAWAAWRSDAGDEQALATTTPASMHPIVERPIPLPDPERRTIPRASRTGRSRSLRWRS